MSYVIYELATTRTVKVPHIGTKYFKTEAAAKAALTRGIKAGKLVAGEWAVCEAGYFHEHVEVSVERTNLMSGKTFKEPLNTPYYCSPSSETYWSM